MSKTNRTAYPILLLVGLLAGATGCADKSLERQPKVDTRPMVSEIHQAELDWAWIAAQQWNLMSIEGVPPLPGTSPWIRFREHTWLEGDAGCNRFTANYERKAESGLSIEQIISTRMFCAQPEGAMQQEARFYHLLQQTDAYHAEPDQLDLLSDGAVVLSFSVDDPQRQEQPDQP